MKLSTLTHFIIPVIHFMVFTCLLTPVQSQDMNVGQNTNLSEFPQVKWVKQWPSPGKIHRPLTFKDRFNSIFLGKKPPVLTRPVSVVAYNPDDYWILDQGSRSVFHLEGEVGDIPHFLQKADYDFSSLVGICVVTPAGILFTDSHANKIYRMLPDKKKLQVLNESLLLDQPTGIAYSALTSEIWVVETNAHCLTILNLKGEILKKIGTRGIAAGEFNYPTHIWISKAGLVYVVDAMNFRIQVLNTSGDVISIFGQPGDASGYFSRPKGIATDSYGNIYIVDALFHAVQVFDLKGGFLYTLGNQGRKEGEFWMPSGIFIDGNDYIYVADCYNSRVQVFQLVYGNKK